MAEVIDINEVRRLRSRSRVRAEEHESLRGAVALIRENLADIAERLRTAPASEQFELLDRLDNLSVMLRYGMLMLGEHPPTPDPGLYAIG